jgi:hypothetical protein
LGYFCLLAIMNNAAVNICVQVFIWACFFLSRYLWLDLLSHIDSLCATLWWTMKVVFKVAVPIYIPNSNTQGFQFLYILTNTCAMVWILVSLPNPYVEA